MCERVQRVSMCVCVSVTKLGDLEREFSVSLQKKQKKGLLVVKFGFRMFVL